MGFSSDLGLSLALDMSLGSELGSRVLKAVAPHFYCSSGSEVCWPGYTDLDEAC